MLCMYKCASIEYFEWTPHDNKSTRAQTVQVKAFWRQHCAEITVSVAAKQHSEGVARHRVSMLQPFTANVWHVSMQPFGN